MPPGNGEAARARVPDEVAVPGLLMTSERPVRNRSTLDSPEETDSGVGRLGELGDGPRFLNGLDHQQRGDRVTRGNSLSHESPPLAPSAPRARRGRHGSPAAQMPVIRSM